MCQIRHNQFGWSVGKDPQRMIHPNRSLRTDPPRCDEACAGTSRGIWKVQDPLEKHKQDLIWQHWDGFRGVFFVMNWDSIFQLQPGAFEAASHDQMNMTKIWSECDQKCMTTMNLTDWIWLKCNNNKPYQLNMTKFLQWQTLLIEHDPKIYHFIQ